MTTRALHEAVSPTAGSGAIPQSGRRFWQYWPITVRTTLWYGLSLLVLLSLFSGFIYGAFHVAIHTDFDHHLVHEQRELLPYVQLTPTGPAFQPTANLRSVAYQSDGVQGTFVRLIALDGTVRYESPNLTGHRPWPLRLPGTPEVAQASLSWRDKPLRVHYTPLRAGDGTMGGWIEVAGFEWSLHQELHRLALLIVMGIAAGVVLAMVGGFLLSRRALRPITRLIQAARQVGDEQDFSLRLPVQPGVRDELSELAETFNGMIGQVDAAFSRERRFTADAAHELMTPLTILQNEVEVTLRRPRTNDEYAQSLREVQTDLHRAVRLVKRLLDLTRVDAGAPHPGQGQPVDLARLLRERVPALRALSIARDVELNLSLRTEAPTWVAGDAVQLGEVVTNLVENALKYTPGGGHVEVGLEGSGDEAVIEVRDSGIGFGPEEAGRLFERFYRSDRPEVQAQAGTGLGLAITRAIAIAHGGTLTASSPGEGQGSVFRLTLPLDRSGDRSPNIEAPGSPRSEPHREVTA